MTRKFDDLENIVVKLKQLVDAKSVGSDQNGIRADTKCLTARQELSRQRVGLASPDNSNTHNSNGRRGRRGGWRGRCGRRGRRGGGGGATSYTSAVSVEDREPAELQAT